ncbi:ABC-2 type transport system permease protein [Methanosarcina thermophila]|uniref:ABC transporter, permease protein n=3 Tax=Methanosarcina thermophila TaxID=2210 RepID=A0A1I6X746_METTE|nr:ABC transporter permease [Methanosarcina thermophila]ALK04637.1 MAG: multidrug ABC transporter permease [Methanosarcina sp. 795]NLU57939.1 ABC transporter permease [Methanosarcina thermophila]SFT33902.1 ABC-2 type transport system permease protein [Methanosarcina thermophila]BAW28309.1 ABC transporter, permease protein [Methanosarcina thermophila]GLI13007.1 multidrug ABC transporter permease [Methanosarcina thermophila MST-A1]
MNFEFHAIYWREMVKFFRFKSVLFSSMIQPVMWLAFFGLAMSDSFDKLTSLVPTTSGVPVVDYLSYMGAGIIAMDVLFSSLFGGTTLMFDKKFSLLRETLASPVPRSHIILGIGLSGVTKALIQTFIIIGFGILIGMDFFKGYSLAETFIAILGITLLVAIFTLGFLFLSGSIAITIENPEGMQSILTLLSMPLFFISNALYPIDAFPNILKFLSMFNPLTLLADGIRYFALGSDFSVMGNHYSYTTADITFSFVGLIIFALVMLSAAMWRFNKVDI